MAGRGRRLEVLSPSSTSSGVTPLFPEEAFGIVEIFSEKINEINLATKNQSLMNAFEELVKQTCISKESMEDIFTSLYKAALINSEFGLKLIVAVKNIICFEVDGVTLRNILLNLIQKDFAAKETLSKDKFLNAIMFLGYFYNKIDIGGKPFKILGTALLEYFDLLLQKSPDNLKVLFIQIVINNENLLNEDGLCEGYNCLLYNLRNALINGNLNEQSKCWVLKTIEFMLADLKTNNLEAVEDFYSKKLGNDYLELKPMIANSLATVKKNNKDNLNIEKKTTPNDKNVKSNFVNKSNDIMPRSNNSNKTSNEKFKKRNDISEKFSGLKVGKSLSGDFKNVKGKVGGQQAQTKTPRKDNKKWNSDGRFHFDHDDRFEKDENFYGTQAPRLPRHGNQKKIFEDEKTEKGDGDSKSVNKNLNSSSENAEN